MWASPICPRCGRGASSRRGMLADVEGMEIRAQGHEDAAMIRVFLGDPESEHVAVEPFRGLLVGDPEIDVADACQLDHLGYLRSPRQYRRPG